ncbi:hypothetical protein JA1_000681 [Spathaspora sp. JA1]|nr:hypothetical protein JA1_000681 [Spathaspora sp. JA1]
MSAPSNNQMKSKPSLIAQTLREAYTPLLDSSCSSSPYSEDNTFLSFLMSIDRRPSNASSSLTLASSFEDSGSQDESQAFESSSNFSQPTPFRFLQPSNSIPGKFKPSRLSCTTGYLSSTSLVQEPNLEQDNSLDHDESSALPKEIQSFESSSNFTQPNPFRFLQPSNSGKAKPSRVPCTTDYFVTTSLEQVPNLEQDNSLDHDESSVFPMEIQNSTTYANSMNNYPINPAEVYYDPVEDWSNAMLQGFDILENQTTEPDVPTGSSGSNTGQEYINENEQVFDFLDGFELGSNTYNPRENQPLTACPHCHHSLASPSQEPLASSSQEPLASSSQEPQASITRRRFMCEYPGCTRTYVGIYERDRHMRTHLDEMPFMCSVCKKQFSRRDHARQHRLAKKAGLCAESTIIEIYE